MAAILERPIGAHNDTLEAHSPPSQRNSIEIIDVDTFEEEASASSSSQRSRPAPRPRVHREHSLRETISLVDSDDDEVEIVSSRIRSGHNVDRSRSHRHFISPPPRDASAPPPMPTVPRRYAGHTSLPMRRHPEYPPVMPSPDPLPFEITSSPPVAGPSNPPQRALPYRASAASHHTPVMGLGGALISSNRAQAIQRQREADIAATTVRRGRATMHGYRPSRRFNSFAVTERDDDTYIHMLLNPYMDEDEFIPSTWRHLLNRGRTAQSVEREQYYPIFTHPRTPEPGFTFDFAMPSPDDENAQRGRFFPPTSKDEPIILGDDDDDGSANKPTAGPSSSSSGRETSPEASKLGLLLVCAKCLDPLILNAALDSEEAQYKRIWALRCGHLIDEKCLNILGQPSLDEEPVPDKKGKGKAKAPAQKNTYGVAVPELQSLASAAESTEVSDIRSRLRSRRTTNGDPVMPGAYPGSSATVLLPETPMAQQQQQQQQQQRPSPAKKRKVAARKPKIEAEFQWECPVASCRRVHVSVKIDEIWGPEKEVPLKGAGKANGVRTEPRGAVAVFA